MKKFLAKNSDVNLRENIDKRLSTKYDSEKIVDLLGAQDEGDALRRLFRYISKTNKLKIINAQRRVWFISLEVNWIWNCNLS